MLAARGARADQVDDVLQDAALKLLRNWDRVDPELPLWPLARIIALNCLADRHRGHSEVLMRDLPDRPAPGDAEERGLGRARLSRARAALATLHPRDQSVLLAEIGIGARRDNSAAARMARRRARLRLAQALDRTGTIFGGVSVGWRRLTTWAQSHLSSELEVHIPAAAGTVAALSLVVIALTTPHPEATGPAEDPPQAAKVLTVADMEPLDARVKPSRPSTGMKSKAHSELAPPSSSTDQGGPADEGTTIDAGPARAKSSKSNGNRTVEVCTDHASVGVTVYDSADDDDDGREPDCS